MRVGILGSGSMGGKLGTLFVRAGHEVVFSYARSEEKLKGLASAARAKARAGTPAKAAKGADALVLAAHWSHVGEVLKQAGCRWRWPHPRGQADRAPTGPRRDAGAADEARHSYR
jgi:predicted dinucleotide-binding enzyme